MWTYLLIFLSLITLIAVFVHRALALKKERNQVFDESVEEEEPTVENSDDIPKKDQARAKALSERAKDLLKKGKEQEAIQHFVQALSLDPNHPETLNSLAMLYLQKEMFHPAIELFKQLSMIQDDPVHFSHLGFAHFRQNELEQARDAYQKALNLDDSRPQRFVSLSQVYRLMGQNYHAIMALEKALERDPGNIDYIFLLSELKKELGLLEESLQLLEGLLELDPENMEAKILTEDLKKMLRERD